MGSGKSHIAKILAEKLNYQLLDLDKKIAEDNQMDISSFFKQKGEIAFRKAERRTLEGVLQAKNNIILSLGGGTPAYYNNMEIINENSKSIYLKASINTLATRLSKEKAHRPKIAHLSDDDLPEFIAKHLFERNAFYHQAQHILNVDNKNGEEIADEIINILSLPR